jgi:hypothetical protein
MRPRNAVAFFEALDPRVAARAIARISASVEVRMSRHVREQPHVRVGPRSRIERPSARPELPVQRPAPVEKDLRAHEPGAVDADQQSRPRLNVGVPPAASFHINRVDGSGHSPDRCRPSQSVTEDRRGDVRRCRGGSARAVPPGAAHGASCPGLGGLGKASSRRADESPRQDWGLSGGSRRYRATARPR